MSDIAIIKRYAEGFIEFAQDAIGIDRCIEELLTLKRLLRDEPELREFLDSPAIGLNEKLSFIDATFKGALSTETIYLVDLLLKKGRFVFLPDIAEYARIKYAHGKEVDVVLNTSYMLDTSVIEDIKQRLEKRLKKKAHMYVKIDPELLGGIKITVGNFVVDGSIKKRLMDMKEKLSVAEVA